MLLACYLYQNIAFLWYGYIYIPAFSIMTDILSLLYYSFTILNSMVIYWLQLMGVRIYLHCLMATAINVNEDGSTVVNVLDVLKTKKLHFRQCRWFRKWKKYWDSAAIVQSQPTTFVNHARWSLLNAPLSMVLWAWLILFFMPLSSFHLIFWG